MKLQKMKCPNCDGTLDIDVGDKEYIFCPFCGEKFKVDDGKTEHTINKNININKNVNYTNRTIDETEIKKAEYAYKESKTSLYVLIVCFLILAGVMAISFYMSGQGERAKKKALEEGKVQVGADEDYVDLKYEAVVEQFESTGFSNITTVDLDDSGIAIWKDGKVASVSISGDTSWGTTDYFYPDEPVIISYH